MAASNAGLAAGDTDRFLPYYGEDARIDSTVTRGKVSKPQYAAAMREWLANAANRSFRIDYRVEKVTFTDPTHAVVETSGIVYRVGSFTQGAWSGARRTEWKLEERNGKWLVVESTIK